MNMFKLNKEKNNITFAASLLIQLLQYTIRYIEIVSKDKIQQTAVRRNSVFDIHHTGPI